MLRTIVVESVLYYHMTQITFKHLFDTDRDNAIRTPTDRGI